MDELPARASACDGARPALRLAASARHYTKTVEQRRWRRTASYAGLLAAAFLVAVLGSWKFGTQVDNSAYDHMFRLYQPKPCHPQSAILAIDEATLASIGGMRRIRRPLADGLLLVTAAHPKAVAVDVILTDQGDDPEQDRALAKAFCQTPTLVLSALLMDKPVQWEDPKPEFKRCAAKIGRSEERRVGKECR